MLGTRSRLRWTMFMAASVVVACAGRDPSSDRLPTTAQPVAGMSSTVGAGGSGGTGSDFGNAPLDSGVLDPCGATGCVDAAPPAVPDDDGFSVAEGDCDDFAALVNPGAFDVPGNGIDEDCAGGDAITSSCDEALGPAEADPLAVARAIELCPTSDATSRRWGVLAARWTTPDGQGVSRNASMHGVLPGFGPAFAPRAGQRMLALSSGVARAPGDAEHTADCSDAYPIETLALPSGFDGTSSSCQADVGITQIVDAVALELEIRMPTNASALSFDTAFFTAEYPVYICTPFNDVFQVIVEPMRMGASADGNVVFDLDGNAVTVNNSLLRACTPGEWGGKTFECPLGFAPLMGTGFDSCTLLEDPFEIDWPFPGGDPPSAAQSGASTGWLSTELTVTPGEIITVRISIWDSGDSALDSLALIDNVRFRLRDEPPPPERPQTTPVVVE